ncbi:hypothetical protein [Yinghuangia seranimata]|uniref:hypothetical protein n=1 Tax=Yinghuangia seranimata TaxID=408067 RepID=UPI00248B6B17|nr:hypothetical protein [Yinghuangia seranimata]MDI2128412.1 hypothetical protein [Yinghuangia seranimata]
MGVPAQWLGIVVACRMAPREVAAMFGSRLPAEAASALETHEPSPPVMLIEAALASHDRDLLAALARNRGLSTELVERLAQLGDPVVGAELYDTMQHPAWVREAVWAAVDPQDPAWRDGLAAELLGDRRHWRLTAALRAPFADLVGHAAGQLHRRMPPWAVVDAALRILDLGDAKGVAELADVIDAAEEPAAHPGLADVLREASGHADPHAALTRARDALSGRTRPNPELDAWLLDLRFGGRTEPPSGGVDWDVVTEEEARFPFETHASVELTRQPGCPRPMLFKAMRAALGLVFAARLGRLPLDAALAPHAPHGPHLTDLVTRGLTKGWFDPNDVLDRVGEAGAVLDAVDWLGGIPGESHTAYRVALPDDLAAAVSRLIAPLGDNPACWAALYTLLARFPGSCTELVAAAVERATTDRARGKATTWPRETAARFPAEQPDGARRQLYVLLAAAPEDVQRAVIPTLDARAVQQLTVYYPLSAEVRAHIYRTLGMQAAVANAARWDMPAAVVDQLLDLDDPEVNAYLYDYGAISQDERIRICAGRPRDGGDRVVPISSALVELLTRTSPAKRRHWLLAALDSGDPVLVRVLLGRVKLQTEAGRLRLAVGLWERQGPDAVAALLDETDFPGRRPGAAKHPFPAATHRTIRAALAATTPELGLTALRDTLDAARAPEVVTAYVRGRGGDFRDRVEHAVAETGVPLPWHHFVALHEREPLPDELLGTLADQPGCPRELLLTLLRTVPLSPGSGWLTQVLADGRLDVRDLLELATPAQAVVSYLGQFAMSAPMPAGMAPPLRQARALMIKAGFDVNAPDAWVVAVRLLPDFSGTVAELVTTAASVVS